MSSLPAGEIHMIKLFDTLFFVPKSVYIYFKYLGARALKTLYASSTVEIGIKLLKYLQFIGRE